MKKINEKLQDFLMEIQGKRTIQANWFAAKIDNLFISSWIRSFSGGKVTDRYFKGITEKVEKLIYSGNDKVFKATWFEVWKKSVSILPKKLFRFSKFLEEEIDDLKPTENKPNDPIPDLNSLPENVPPDFEFAEDFYEPPTQKEIDDLNLKSEWNRFLGVKIKEKEVISEIAKGVTEGLDYFEIANSIYKFVRDSKNSATSIARTEILRINNAAQEQGIRKAFKKTLKSWKYSATLDLRTRPNHAFLDGKIFKDDEPRPLLPDGQNCRCNYIPVIKSWAELGLPELDSILTDKERTSMDGTVPGSEKYSSWFDKQSDKRKMKILGKDKFEKLKKNGKVFWSDFVKMKNSPTKIQPIATVKGDRIKKGTIRRGRKIKL